MNTIGRNPSGLILDGLAQAIPEAAIGWDMPASSTMPRVRLALDRAAYPTAVSQYMRLRVSVYAPQGDGRTCDWPKALALSETICRWLLDNRRKRPLIDASDDDLRQDFAYTVILLTVEAA